MAMRTQEEKGRAFKALHERPDVFVIPNPWDVGTARLLAALGFEALATTSAGFAFSLGRPDGGVTREETLSHCRALCEAVDLPVSADLEKCFADSPDGVAETIRLAARTGIVGGSVEDATGDPGGPIYEFSLAVERVRAAVEAARSLSFPFMLTARAENYLHGRKDLKDTIRRLQAFQEAGADVLYAPGLATLEDIRAVTSSVAKPVNVVMGSWNPDLTVAELARAGVRRISVGGALARTALGAFLRAAEEIRGHGGFTYVRGAAPSADLNRTFGRPGRGPA
jgi:2-methylisocitrate lyase-like PEP mutase family enzyme